MPKVSVVVPVYNIEGYLEKSIDSLVHQTMEDIEIILVDDGSTDASGEICERYASKDSRIRVIHKENEGLSCARNDGIEASSAPYVMFVDGDDWVEPEYCERPYREAMDKKADLVFFTYSRVYSDGKIVRRETGLHEGLVSEADAMSFNVRIAPAAMFSLYRKDLFDRIQFCAGKYHEDYGTTHKLIHQAGRICYVDVPLYHYRVKRPGSITSGTDSRKQADRIEMISSRIYDLHDWGYGEYALDYALFLLARYGKGLKEYSRTAEVVRTTPVPASFNQKKKAALILFKVFPSLFEMMCKISGKRELLS